MVKYACYGYYRDETDRWVKCDEEEVSVGQYCSRCGSFKTDVVGVVVYKNSYFFAVRGEHYVECFLNVDVENGDYIILKPDGRREVARKKNRKQTKLGLAKLR